MLTLKEIENLILNEIHWKNLRWENLKRNRVPELLLLLVIIIILCIAIGHPIRITIHY